MNREVGWDLYYSRSKVEQLKLVDSVLTYTDEDASF